MSTQTEFLISIAICYLVVVPFFKALRDIIAFRFERSVFACCPQWLRRYLTANEPGQAVPLDGWHQTDGAVVCVPMLLVVYWGNRLLFHLPWWKAVIAFAYLAALFYVIFNLLFHRLLMKRD